jgi:hypothetical protein
MTIKESSRKKHAVHSDTSTLDGARYVLTVKNERKLKTEGPLTAGSAVLCLRNDTGYYVPCVATVVSVAAFRSRYCRPLHKQESAGDCE